METAGSPEQVDVLAATVKGDVTVAPLYGVETVMACEDTEKVASANAAKSKVFMRRTSSDMAMNYVRAAKFSRAPSERTAGELHCRCF